MNVGKMVVLLFKTGRAERRERRFAGDVNGICRELSGLCRSMLFDATLLEEWLAQIGQVSSELAENHTYDCIDVQSAVADGSAALVCMGLSSWETYSVFAEAAAGKERDIAYVTAGFYGAVARTVMEQLRPEVNSTVRSVPSAELFVLSRAIWCGLMFHVEAAAYRDADWKVRRGKEEHAFREGVLSTLKELKGELADLSRASRGPSIDVFHLPFLAAPCLAGLVLIKGRRVRMLLAAVVLILRFAGKKAVVAGAKKLLL